MTSIQTARRTITAANRPARRRYGRSCSVLFLSLAIGCVLPGCITTRGIFPKRHRDHMAGAPRLKNAKNPQLEDVVEHLNRNTDRLHCWRANNVRIRAGKWSLSGTIAVEKDRHLHLVVNSLRGNEVDLGSNDERFWVWSREMEPSFVTCKQERMWSLP